MDNSKLSVLKTFSSAGGDLSKIRLVVNEADAAKAEEILAAGFDQEEFDTESAKRRKKP